MDSGKRRGEPAAATKRRRTTRKTKSNEDNGLGIYGDMLAEVAANSPALFENDSRPVKRRKRNEESLKEESLLHESTDATAAEQRSASVEVLLEDERTQQQVELNDFEVSDKSDETDVEFEDVDLGQNTGMDDSEQDRPEQKSLQLDLSRANLTPPRSVSKRKPVGAAERKTRLEVHKCHVLCLLAHVQYRNWLCDNEEIQSILKPLVPRKTLNMLHVDESQPQYQRSHSFNKAIEDVCATWRQAWQITIRGIRRAYWMEDQDVQSGLDETEDIDLDDFRRAARNKRGSRDLGAQLFCALLRSLAVETRLVCSLQALPFSAVAKGQTPERGKSPYIRAPPQDFNKGPQQAKSIRADHNKSSKKRVVDSAYPVFWVEVLSPATATWIPLDPLVRNTINKPKTGFEPPAADPLNSMSYVIAFEEMGSAKDVTRRYAQWYNAKTRKTRVESTKYGERWWQKAMSVFEKHYRQPRDDVEDVELSNRAGNEPMPKNVQDFKGHPVYVLERHLRENEVIFPRKPSGKITAGTSKNAKLEDVFKRQNVYLCRSADGWYRRGRDVREGEQPLKQVKLKRKRDQGAVSFEQDEEGEHESTALYAEFQTDLYVPPSVVGTAIPKNAYGNLDVYVSSMIPPGAVHIRHPLAAKSAKVLGIDYADAVTGFEFKGRTGTAIVDGVVVSRTLTAAMAAVIEGLEYLSAEEVEAQRSAILLGMWKRWVKALRIREKVEREYGDKEDVDRPKSDDDADSTYQDDEDAGGGFMPESIEADGVATRPHNDDFALPPMPQLPSGLPDKLAHQRIVVVQSPHTLSEYEGPVSPASMTASKDTEGDVFGDKQEPGGFLGDTDEGNQLSAQPLCGPCNEDDEEDDESGGFLHEAREVSEPAPTEPQALGLDRAASNGEVDMERGGFLVEDEDQAVSDTMATPFRPQPNSVLVGAATADAVDAGSQSESPRSLPGDGNASEASLLSHDPDEEDAAPEWLLDE